MASHYKKIIREHVQKIIDNLIAEKDFSDIEIKHIKNELMPNLIEELNTSYKQKSDYYEKYQTKKIEDYENEDGFDLYKALDDYVDEKQTLTDTVLSFKDVFSEDNLNFLSENSLMKFKSYVNLMSYSKDKKNITQQWQPPKHITEKMTPNFINTNIGKLRDKYNKIPNDYWNRVNSLVQTFNQKNSEVGIFIANTEKNNMKVEKITGKIDVLDNETFSKDTTKVINAIKENTLKGVELILLDKHQEELKSELMSILRVYFKYNDTNNHDELFNNIQKNLDFRLTNGLNIQDFVNEFISLTDEEKKPSVKDYDVFNKSLLINRYEFYTFAYLKNLSTLDSFLGKAIKDEQDKISIVFIRPQLLNILNNMYFTINKLPKDHIYANKIPELSKKINKLIETLELLPYTTKDLKQFLNSNPNFIINLQSQIQDLNRIDNLHIKTLFNDEFANNLPNVKDLLDKSLMSVFTMYGDNNDFLEAFSEEIGTSEIELQKKLLNKRVEISLLDKLGIPFDKKDETILHKNGVSTICLNKDLLEIVKNAITNNIEINEKHLFTNKTSLKDRKLENNNQNMQLIKEPIKIKNDDNKHIIESEIEHINYDNNDICVPDFISDNIQSEDISLEDIVFEEMPEEMPEEMILAYEESYQNFVEELKGIEIFDDNQIANDIDEFRDLVTFK